MSAQGVDIVSTLKEKRQAERPFLPSLFGVLDNLLPIQLTPAACRKRGANVQRRAANGSTVSPAGFIAQTNSFSEGVNDWAVRNTSSMWPLACSGRANSLWANSTARFAS